MKASSHEQQYAQINDVKLRCCASPRRVMSLDGHVTGIEFDVTKMDKDGRISNTGNTYQLEADVIFKAIGQTLPTDNLGVSAGDLTIENGRIVVNDDRRTSLNNVWAGGDCVLGGEDLTVSAVQDGKQAAQSIHEYLQDS